jgi:hypothetical protein
MKEFEAKSYNATYGQMNIHMRILGRKIYLKTADNPQARQMMEKLRQGGASVIEGTKGWVEIDMFANNTNVRLGGKEFDTAEMRDEEIEVIL